MPVYSWDLAHRIQLTAENQTMHQPILTAYIQLPGIYNCTASNSQGSRTKHFTVVEAPSKILSKITTFLFLYCLIAKIIPSCCCFPSGSKKGTTAGILLAVFFALIVILACVVYQKQKATAQNRWAERETVTQNFHLPQGITQRSQPWLEYLRPWESCSSLAGFILSYPTGHLLATKATIWEDSPPLQDLYEAFLKKESSSAWQHFFYSFFGAWKNTSFSYLLKGQGVFCMVHGFGLATVALRDACSNQQSIKCLKSIYLY